MRKLTLPCALLVMGAVAACQSGLATSPDSEVGVPQLGLTAVAGCPPGFDLILVKNAGYVVTAGLDRNKDGYFCQKITKNGKTIAIDNSVPLSGNGCSAGTTEFIITDRTVSHP